MAPDNIWITEPSHLDPFNWWDVTAAFWIIRHGFNIENCVRVSKCQVRRACRVRQPGESFPHCSVQQIQFLQESSQVTLICCLIWNQNMILITAYVGMGPVTQHVNLEHIGGRRTHCTLQCDVWSFNVLNRCQLALGRSVNVDGGGGVGHCKDKCFKIVGRSSIFPQINFRKAKRSWIKREWG